MSDASAECGLQAFRWTRRRGSVHNRRDVFQAITRRAPEALCSFKIPDQKDQANDTTDFKLVTWLVIKRP